MAIRRHARSVILTGAFTVVAAGLGVSLAFAAPNTGAHTGRATTWTISPGASATSVWGKTVLTDTRTSARITCASARASGVLKSGSGLSGIGIGSTSQQPSFSNCDGPDGIVVITIVIHFPWVDAASYNPATKVTTGQLSGIDATISGSGCSATMDGTSPGADNGIINGTYSNVTGGGALLSGGNMHLYNVSGCFGAFANGDPIAFSGSYSVTPKQIATSP